MAIKEYSNNQVTVVWQPNLCIHSRKCVNGLGEVFDPEHKPWINLSMATSEAIVETVSKCPSGALSIKNQEPFETVQDTVKVQLMPGGPLVLKGICEVVDENGNYQTQKNVAFCRCTKSQNFPYCDGSHRSRRAGEQ